ncbi:hypothetical protein [Acidicapsa ligni]|uniref:hypothetical protein n=1 Tax=Acidicapsa ligni TaxID=542300 RepID=UPI0021E00F13|nr:hypothetical protein [Acidicapsa ligni]
MTSDSKEDSYSKDKKSVKRPALILQVGMVAAASAFAGGLAVAWWHRKTLTKLQNPILSSNLQNPESSYGEELGMEEEDPT